MKYIPNWVTDALMSKKFKCHNCQKIFTHKNVKVLGIRDGAGGAGKESFFMELGCFGCRKATFFEMQEMDIAEFAKAVIAEMDTNLEDTEAEEVEFNEEDMFSDKTLSNKEIGKEEIKKYLKKKKEVSKITLKDIRKVKSVLKPKDFKHESLLEMMGMSPEEVAQYNRETE